MMERALLPMEQAMHEIGHDPTQDPLKELQEAILSPMRSIVSDDRTRRIFEVATLKIEYVDELLAIKARHVQAYTEGLHEIHRSLMEAATRRGLNLPMPPAMAAQGLQALMAGLIHTWLLAPHTFELVPVAEQAIAVYLSGLGLKPCNVTA